MKSFWNESILDQVKDMVYVVSSENHKLVSANQRFKERFPEYHEGIKCHKLIFGIDEPCEVCGINQATHEKPAVLKKFITSGELIEVSFQKKLANNGSELCICTASNLPSVIESIEIVREILNGLHAAAYTINPATYRVTFVNSYLNGLLPEMRRGALCYEALMGLKKPCTNCPFKYLKHNGDTYHMNTYISKLNKFLNIDAMNIVSEDGIQSVVFTGYDITAQVEKEKKLSKIAYLDLSVNLKNRIAFLRDAENIFKSNSSCFIYLVRLKNFSNYNLMLGRKAGDEFIKELVKYYCSIYPDRTKIYRVGGVKFLFIAETKLENEKIKEIAKNPIPPNISHRSQLFLPKIDFAGIEVPSFANNSQQVLHHLEYILSKPKNTDDSNQIIHFEQADISKIERDSKITTLVKSNVKTNGFEVFYQPIYSIANENFSKCEALIRLYNDELGWVSPNEFISIAEANGTIGYIGQFVLEEVCKTLEERKLKNLPNVQINVNVSAVQFSTEDFYQTVYDTISKYDFDRKLLHLEITESIMINSFEYILDIMNKIIKLGIDFSIDDFGTGYSNISYLGALPFKELKLDRSFVEHVATSDVHVMIVRNVVKFSKDLHFKVVAEGVETFAQYNVLKRLGCDYIQGYLFSKPIPKSEYDSFLEKHFNYKLS